MKQKLLAALALASEAKILVCDEPTANLDPRARAAFFAQVEERPSDAILVLCSHRVDEVRHLVRRVVELRDGVVVRDAAIGDVLTEVRSCRIDVTLREDTKSFLANLGFERVGARRYSALFTQEEKLEVVHALLRDHGHDVADLAVFDEENGFVAPASGTVRAVGVAS
jgi:ABC-type multidrug transport system ATPase subunit